MAILEDEFVPTIKRRFQTGALGSQYETPTPEIVEPEVPEVKPQRKTYNVEDVQSIGVQPLFKSSLIASALGLGAGFNAANALRLRNEALAAEQGLRAFYNAPQAGETVVRTAQGFQYGGPFEEIFTRAGGDITRMNVAYVDDELAAAGRLSAMADETITRGQQVVPEAYRYVRLPSQRFAALKPITRAVLRGVGEAANTLTAFQLIPGLTIGNFLNNLMLPQYRGKPNVDV